LKAELEARFLFGDEVLKRLETLRGELAFLNTYTNAMIADPHLPDRNNIIQQKYKCLKGLANWSLNTVQVFAPYIRLTQKQRNVWWPF